MNFVNDVYLVPTLGGSKSDILPKIPDLINAPVRRTVNFHYIHGIPVTDQLAVGTDITGIRRRSLPTV